MNKMTQAIKSLAINYIIQGYLIKIQILTIEDIQYCIDSKGLHFFMQLTFSEIGCTLFTGVL